jgi:cytochrome P450
MVQTFRYLRDPIKFLEDCRKEYGGTFTATFPGPREAVFTSDRELIKTVFAGSHESTAADARNFLFEPAMGPRSVLLVWGDDHMRRRKVILPAFHGERMRAYEGLIAQIALAELESWPLNKAFPVYQPMIDVTMAVILRAVFGIEEGASLDRLTPLVHRMAEYTSPPFRYGLGLLSRKLGSLGPRGRLLRVMKKIDPLIMEEIARRRSDPNLADREDICSLLIQARYDDGSPMDDLDIRDQLMTLLLAGHRTTAAALAWAFDLLPRNDAVLARLREGFADPKDPYLEATVEEILRIRPVFPTVGRHLGTPVKTADFDLPEGTNVLSCVYLLHTREDIYPEPYEFKPERFLDGGPDTYSWIPFGGGTRRCLGGAFAMMSMRVILRTIFSRAEIRHATGIAEPIVKPNVTLVPKNGARIVVESRR